MAITIRKKVVEAPVPVSTEGLSAIDLVFGVEASPAKDGLVHGIGLNMKVTITNDKFKWIKYYQPGDTGVVTKVFSEAELQKSYPGYDPKKHGLYTVTLDKIRVPGMDSVDVPRWGLEPK